MRKPLHHRIKDKIKEIENSNTYCDEDKQLLLKVLRRLILE